MEKFIRATFDTFIKWISSFWEQLLVALVIVVIGYFLTKLILKILHTALNKANIDFSLEKFLINTSRIFCYVIIIISSLSQLGISTTGLLAFFSAAAATIALSLKDSLSNIACGIILLFSRPFVTGDVIEINSERCTVEQIDLMHTKVLTFDNRFIMIPNSVISSKEVVNFSAKSVRRIDIKIPVSYNSDIEQVKSVITEVAEKNPQILSEPEKPFVRITSFSDSSVDFIVKVWVNTENYWDVYYDMLENIKISLDNNNISIPYNQLDIHIENK